MLRTVFAQITARILVKIAPFLGLLLIFYIPTFAGSALADSIRVLGVSFDYPGITNDTSGSEQFKKDLDYLNRSGGFTADRLVPFYKRLDYYGLDLEVVTKIQLPKQNAAFSIYRLKANKKGQERIEKPYRADLFFVKHEPAAHEVNFFDDLSPTYQKQIPHAEAVMSAVAVEFEAQFPYSIVQLHGASVGLAAPLFDLKKQRGERTPIIVGDLKSLEYKNSPSGGFSRDVLSWIGLDDRYFTVDGVEFWGSVSPVKAIMNYVDGFKSPVYQDSPFEGFGVEGVLTERIRQFHSWKSSFSITQDPWLPHRPPRDYRFIAGPPNSSAGKDGKAYLQSEFGLTQDSEAVIIVLSDPVSVDNGYQYIPGALAHALYHHNVQIIVIGREGPNDIEKELFELEERYPKKFERRMYSPEIENTAIRGADFYLSAPQFHAPGLGDLKAKSVGTVPLVTLVDGYRQHVRDAVDGLVAQVQTVDAEGVTYVHIDDTRVQLIQMIERAVGIYRHNPKKYRSLQRQAMQNESSWFTRIESQKIEFRYLQINGPEKLRALLTHDDSFISETLEEWRRGLALSDYLVTALEKGRDPTCAGALSPDEN